MSTADVKEIIDGIKGNLPFGALKKLEEKLSEENHEEFLNEFLLTSDDCNEILFLLDKEHRASSELTDIFSALGSILLGIAKDLNTHQSIGNHICRHVLNNCSLHLYKNTSKSNTQRNVMSVFKLLTGMVLLGKTYALEVLTSLDLEKLHFDHHLKRRDPTFSMDVRGWAVYLLLSFLNTMDSTVIVKFLQNHEPLTLIFAGLNRDPYDRVINVLTVMHQSILCNPEISKTLKVKIFFQATVKPILDLYSWGDTKIAPNISEQEENLKKREQVIKTLQKFLLTLCASRKYGVIFLERVPEPHIKSNNHHVSTILKKLPTPWLTAEGRELVCETLTACPDIVSYFSDSYIDYFVPRPTQGFNDMMQLFIDVIDKQKPWSRIAIVGLDNVINVSIPMVNNKLISQMIKSEYKSIRFVASKLVLSILNKAKEFCDVIQGMKEYNSSQKNEIKKKIYETTITRVTGKAFLYVDMWNSETLPTGKIQTDENSEKKIVNKNKKDKKEVSSMEEKDIDSLIPTLSDALITIANILVKIMELNNGQTPKEVLPLEMLNYIRHHQDKEEKIDYITLQAICLQLLSEDLVHNVTSTSLPDNHDFKDDVLYQLIATYQHSHFNSLQENDLDKLRNLTKIKNSCASLLSKSLRKCGLSTQESSKLWLQHLFNDDSNNSSKFLTLVLHKLLGNLSYYSDQLLNIAAESSNTHDSEDLFTLDSLEGAEIQDNIDISAIDIPLSFSPMIIAAIDALKKDNTSLHQKYVANVLFDYLHTLQEPNLLISFLSCHEDLLHSDITKYVKFWDSCGTIECKIKSQDNKYSTVIRDIFLGGKFSGKHSEVEDSLFNEPTEVIKVVNQLVLYIHFELLYKRSPTKLEFYATTLKQIIETLVSKYKINITLNLILNTLLKQPKILKYYEPFSEDNIITKTVFNLIKDVCTQNEDLMMLSKPFYAKTIKRFKKLSKTMKKSETHDLFAPFEPFLKCHHLVISFFDIEELFIYAIVILEENISLLNIHKSLEKLLVQLAELIENNKSSRLTFTHENVGLLFDKFITLAKSCKFTQQFLTKIENILVSQIDENFVPFLEQSNNKDVIKSLLKVECVGSYLIKRMSELSTSSLDTTVALLLKKKLPLEQKVPLLSYLVEERENKDVREISKHAIDMITILSKEEPDLLEYYKNIFSQLLQHDLYSHEEIGEIIKTIYNRVIEQCDNVIWFIEFFDVFDKAASMSLKVFDYINVNCPYIALIDIIISLLNHICLDENSLAVIEKLNYSLVKILPKINSEELKKHFAQMNNWDSFIDKTLPTCLIMPTSAPVINIIRIISSELYKRGKNKGLYLPSDILERFLDTSPNSPYLNIMLDVEQQYESTKLALLKLHLELAQCKLSVCVEDHVPILLASYGATMSQCDQTILVLLRYYEKNNKMETIQPIIWGTVAASHFNVESNFMTTLHRKPTIKQTLSCIKGDKLIESCIYFNNKLDLEPEVVESEPHLYDLRFLLPLMIHLSLNIGEFEDDLDYASCGICAVGVAALTSYNTSVWNLGATVLQAIYQNMEISRHRRFKEQYMWFVGVIGLAMDGERQQLPSLTAYFLIKASYMFNHPSNTLFMPVLNYLYLRPALKINEVPELYKFFFSDDVQHHSEFQKFLLEMLTDGVKESRDLQVTEAHYTYKLILGLLTSSNSDLNVKVLVLKLLSKIVTLWRGAIKTVRTMSLLTILTSLVQDSINENQEYKSSISSQVVNLLNILWNTLSSPNQNKESTISGDDTKAKKRKKVSKSSPKKKLKTENGNSSSDDSMSSSEDSDEEIKIDDKKSVEKSHKVLPILFIKDMLTCLNQIRSIVMKCCPSEICAIYLDLLKDVVIHLQVLEYESYGTITVREVTMSSKQIKSQMNDSIDWKLLQQRLKKNLSHDEDSLISLKTGQLNDVPSCKSMPLCNLTRNAGIKADEPTKLLIKSTMSLIQVLGE